MFIETLTNQAQSWWPFLADFVVQATVLLSGVLAIYSVSRRFSSARKHALLLAGFIALPLLLAATTLSSVRWQLPQLPQLPGTRPAPDLARTIAITPIALHQETTISSGLPAKLEAATMLTAQSPAPVVLASPQLVNNDRNWPAIALSVWAVGTMIFSVRLLIGWLSLSLASRRLNHIHSPKITAEFERIIKRQPHLKRTRLLTSLTSSMPMTFGFFSPAVVMPEDADTWSNNRVRRVLLHELAHVTRRDCLTNALALASFCLLWFHPLTWICWRLLRCEQESAADDWAIQQTADPEAYADDLIAIVRDYPRHMSGVGLALSIAMARGNSALKRRLDAMLDDRRDRSTCGYRLILTSLPFLLIAVITLGGLAACRDEITKVDVQETRTFDLSPVQKKRLMVSRDEEDPFADRGRETLLLGSLNSIKKRIDALNLDPAVSNISLPDEHTLVVTAARSSMKRIDEWLASYNGTLDIHLGIEIRMFKTPGDTNIDTLLNLDNKRGDGSVAGTLSHEAGLELLESLRANQKLQSVQIPVFVTRSGERAKFEHIREVIYPTEYDPPSTPQATADSANVSKVQSEILRLETLMGIPGDRIIEEAEDLGILNATIKNLFPKRLELKTRLAGLQASGADVESPELQAVHAELFETDRQLDNGVKATKNAMATQREILAKSISPNQSLRRNGIILPSTPSAFETRNVGTTYEFFPHVLDDSRIDLELNLEHVRLLGFTDFGTPIRSGSTDAGEIESANKILMPMFESSQYKSTTTLASGSWIVVAGLGAKETSGASNMNESNAFNFEKDPNLDDSQFIILVRVSIDD
ncbi:MAG: beta-lactamase regulating signal transducer with metallopeptidase domain [Verrucomicrobiales bacterium]|jgi:beta-lactamase regulating signal transducer with metallopeptidase domain